MVLLSLVARVQPTRGQEPLARRLQLRKCHPNELEFGGLLPSIKGPVRCLSKRHCNLLLRVFVEPLPVPGAGGIGRW